MFLTLQEERIIVMRFCLMDPRPFTWDRLVWMNRQWQGITFLDFQDESPPRFIINLVEELQREGIAESIAPCQTFAKSFMMVSPATKRRDLVLLLRPLNEECMSRLEQWRNNRGEQIIMPLPDYIKQYAAEFTGIGQSAEASDPDKKVEQVQGGSPKKYKKDRRKQKRPSEPSEEANSDNTGNEADPEEAVNADDSSEASDEVGEDQ